MAPKIENKIEISTPVYVHPSKMPKCRLIIHRQEGVIGQADVFVGVNGYAYTIRRGDEVEVPKMVLENLRNAVVTILTKDKDGNDVLSNVPRFAFTVVQEDVASEQKSEMEGKA